jgi:hypothetical protein
MSPSAGVIFYIRVLALALGLVAAVRIYRLDFHRKYKFFFIFLSFQAAQSLALLACNFYRAPKRAYGQVWFVTEPVIWVLYILVVLELYSVALINFKGLQTAGRWMLWGALPLAVAISAATMVPTWRSPTERFPLVFYFLLIERGIMFSLVVFILLTLLFLSWYPVPLNRNIIVHCFLCTFLLLSGSMGFLVRNVAGDTVMGGVNIALASVTTLCWLGWLILLSPAGEAGKVTLRRVFDPEDEKRLIAQLTSINSSLLRATRK